MNIFDYTEHELAGDVLKYEKNPPNILNTDEAIFIRCDGKAFKNFTKKFEKPFDSIFRNTMEKTMVYLANECQCSWMGYTQSDEITIMLKKPNIDSQIMFGGRRTKIETFAAATCTLAFNKIFIEEVNKEMAIRKNDLRTSLKMSETEIEEVVNHEYEKYTNRFLTALFDARAFNMPKGEEWKVFGWRLLDCHGNAIQMVARHNYSIKELQNKSCSEMKEMIIKNGDNIDNYEQRYMYGRMAIKKEMKMYEGTERECIRNKFVLENSLTVFENNYFFGYCPSDI